jgi:hypothetical protein
MRAKAPFPILPVLFGFVFALSLPLMLAATPLASRYVPTALRRSSQAEARQPSHKNAHKDELRSAAKMHKAQRSPAAKAASKRNHRPAGTRKQAKSKPRGVRLQESPADRATSRRVHAWVEGSGKSRSGAKPLTAPSVAADARASSADGTAAGADPAKPESVISTIRTSTDKPQLPPVEELAAEPVILPSLYNKRGRLVVPPPLKGSHEILVHQNLVANDEGLDRIHDDADLERMRRTGVLVAIPSGSTLRIDERLTPNRRYCRPWTALFLDTLARQHYARFQTALQVNSAVRTVEFQQRLVHTNGNAAPAEGDTASPHLTGQAVDIAKRGLSMTEIAWLRGYLLPLVQQGKIDVEEEFQQSCFHISVYKSYMPQSQTNRRMIATTHREGMGTLGMSLK